MQGIKRKTLRIIILALLIIALLPLNLVLLYGPIILFTAPAFLLAAVILYVLKIPRFYSRFCIGFLLEFALVSAIMGYAENMNTLSNLISFLIGAVGFLITSVSLGQWVFKIKALPSKYEIALNVITVIGAIFTVIIMISLFSYLLGYTRPVKVTV